jgi:tRNA-specific 2-thiouridylase
VRCNQHIKFTPLLRRARALGASSLVTGHYARLRRGEAGRVELWRAVDRTKDQSYFLFHMPPAALDFVRFPLGELDKGAVRSEARRLGLPVADKAESQEICFVPDGDHAAFVAAARPEVEAGGELVDTAGNVIGRHGGIHQFTIGQRRGIRVASLERRYVVDVDAQTARVVVGTAEELSTSTIWVEELTWLGAPAPSEPFRAEVQIRYRHAPEPAWVTPAGPGAVRVDFDRPERGPAAGQAAVLYLGERVLGGGFLTRSAPTGGTT